MIYLMRSFAILYAPFSGCFQDWVFFPVHLQFKLQLPVSVELFTRPLGKLSASSSSLAISVMFTFCSEKISMEYECVKIRINRKLLQAESWFIQKPNGLLYMIININKTYINRKGNDKYACLPIFTFIRAGVLALCDIKVSLIWTGADLNLAGCRALLIFAEGGVTSHLKYVRWYSAGVAYIS